MLEFLRVVSMIFIAIVGVMIVWNVFETKNVYEKIGGTLMLLLIVLRLLGLK